MSTITVNTIEPVGSTLTVGSATDTVTVPTGATISGAISMVPAFEAYNNGNQSLSDATATKLEFDTEVYDTNSAYSSNRFTPGVAGKYFIYSKSHFGTGSDTTLIRCYYYIYKNGSSYAMTNFDTRAGGNFRVLPNHISATLDLNATDYVEIYAYVDVSSGSITGPNSGEKQIFGGYKLNV